MSNILTEIIILFLFASLSHLHDLSFATCDTISIYCTALIYFLENILLAFTWQIINRVNIFNVALSLNLTSH